MNRLSPETLAHVPAAVARPRYDRAGLRTGIVHLGLGAFARAHLTAYTEDVANAGGGEGWGIAGVSMRKPDVVAQLAPQDGLYALLVRDGARTHAQVCGIVHTLYVLPESPAAVVDALAAPDTKIVSLTVTEKGYCHDPATGQLNESHPDIQHDLAHPDAPRSAIGVIVAGLARRRAAGLLPFTVLSCDNLPSNGKVVRGLVLRFAALRDSELAQWIAAHGAFPCAMVDRIVPATTDADRADAQGLLGIADDGVISTEPFRQWVIEDRFCAGRPAWEDFGAEMVDDVAPFEFMKLRMLNGAHSSLAYLGYLAGHAMVSQGSADPVFVAYLKALWREIIPTVPVPPGVDLAAYAAALLARFQNTAIRHRTWQIAMDGSQKLPQRLLGTIRDRLAQDQPIGALAFGVAGWMRYIMAVDEKGAAIDVRDPMAADFVRVLAQTGRDPQRIVAALTGLAAIFGADLVADPRFRATVTDALDAVLREGARGALGRFAGQA
ncbi:MAG: mannitol dehydrogenase family protein [Beijerinckiaceae bacterium]